MESGWNLEVPCISRTMMGVRLFPLCPVYVRVSCAYVIIKYSSSNYKRPERIFTTPFLILPSPGLSVALTLCVDNIQELN